MIIMFVRHGEAKDDKLTKLGLEQCKLLVSQEEDYAFSKIYCSSVRRCKETAKFLAEKYNLEITYLSNLKDRELLKDVPQTEDEQEWYDNYLNKNYSHINPEGCKEFLQRNFNEFEIIIKTHLEKNENVIIVAHSCTFYALQEFFNKSEEDAIKYYRLGNCSKVYFEI